MIRLGITMVFEACSRNCWPRSMWGCSRRVLQLQSWRSNEKSVRSQTEAHLPTSQAPCAPPVFHAAQTILQAQHRLAGPVSQNPCSSEIVPCDPCKLANLSWIGGTCLKFPWPLNTSQRKKTRNMAWSADSKRTWWHPNLLENYELLAHLHLPTMRLGLTPQAFWIRFKQWQSTWQLTSVIWLGSRFAWWWEVGCTKSLLLLTVAGSHPFLLLIHFQGCT